MVLVITTNCPAVSDVCHAYISCTVGVLSLVNITGIFPVQITWQKAVDWYK